MADTLGKMQRLGPQTSAANAANTITLAALANFWYVLKKLIVSFSAAPTGPVTVTVSTGGANLWVQDLTGVGPHTLDFGGVDLEGTPGANVVVTVGAGGAGITSNLHGTYKRRTK